MLHARVTRWLSDEPQPGIVQVEIIDADDRRWLFEDKTAIFSAETILPSSPFPLPIKIDCQIVGREVDSAGQETVIVDTARPWGIESTQGTTTFRVRPADIAEV